jgi:hypothetical protein
MAAVYLATRGAPAGAEADLDNDAPVRVKKPSVAICGVTNNSVTKSSNNPLADIGKRDHPALASKYVKFSKIKPRDIFKKNTSVNAVCDDTFGNPYILNYAEARTTKIDPINAGIDLEVL